MKKRLGFGLLLLTLLCLGNPAIRTTLAQTGVANTAAELAGKYLMVRDADETVTGLKTFSRSTNPPFAVNSGAAKVSNLDADKIDGLDSTVFSTVTATITTTGTSTALAIPSAAGTGVIYCNNATLLTIQGITAGTADGQRLYLFSMGAGQVDFVHQSGSASAALRLINFATSGNTSLAPGVGVAVFAYDLANARWRLLLHNQGDYIDYAATSTIVGWTTPTKVVKYWLRDRTLTATVNISGTSSTTAASFTIPYTPTATTFGGTLEFGEDSTSALTVAGRLANDSGASSVISAFTNMASGLWTASGTKIVRATWVGQVS